METRRDSLKIIGAIGATCAFPFAADELYGQHVHETSPPMAEPAGEYAPKFFTPAEYETISRIGDLIIPETDTPGAVGAGVPRYIDVVANANQEHRKPLREGIAWLDRQPGGRFVALTEVEQIALLTPLSDAADAGKLDAPGARFFDLLKKLTADGYYTSRIGLVRELGYQGNTALAEFPQCASQESAQNGLAARGQVPSVYHSGGAAGSGLCAVPEH